LDIITYSKLKKCISIDINAGHSFASNTDRDTFFTNNPTQLKANMYIYCNGQLQQYINSAWEVRSTAIQGSKGDKGDAGISPHIDLATNNWFIDTVDTGVKAVGMDGNDGTTPHIDETTNNWFIGTTNTGIKAVGVDGISPHIGVNGNWYIGETDTLVKAIAVDGTSPHIGENGNWFIGETDTLVKAEAIDGVGIQSVVDNGDDTFTITLTNGTSTIINKIDNINSDNVTQGITNLYVSPTEKNKLTNIEENAEVNNISDTNATDLTDGGDTTLHYHSSDRDRTNHTGTQAISTVSGLQTALDNKANKDFTLYTQKADVVSDDKIVINDSADSNSIKYVTLNQLISSVQDPHNKGYYETGITLNTAIPTANDGDFAVVGETNTIWVWSSTDTAFVNSGANGAVLSINGRTGIITLTKADVGLNNVVNLDTSTTSNITDSVDKRFVTDADLIILGNTSGTNTGDETNETIVTKLGTDLSNKVDKEDGKSLISDTEITRLASVTNYDDTILAGRVTNLETDTHTHTNKTVLDNTSASFTTTYKSKLDGIAENATADSVMVGATSEADGTSGLVPKPLIADKDRFLKGNGAYSDVSADLVTYDNTTSQLISTTVNGAINELKNKITPISFSILTSAWISDTTYTGYDYRATIENVSILSTDKVDVTFDMASLILANIASVAGATVEYTGGFYLYSKIVPTDTLTGTYIIWR